MKYLSLFSGIGGFELGIQQAYESDCGRFLQSKEAEDIQDNFTNDTRRQNGVTCIGYSEIDKYAIQVYEKHFGCTTHTQQQKKGTGNTEGQSSECTDQCTNRFGGSPHKNYGDITKINPATLPDFDFLVGGFPCQAFSIAGKRRGFEDTRGTLFFDIARILKAKQPRFFVLENVKGLLSHDSGRTFKIIITTIAELGYAVEWQVLNAKNHGVPQNRERVFIIGHLGGFGGRQVFPIGEGCEKNIKSDERWQAEVFPTIRATHYKNGDNQTTILENYATTHKTNTTKALRILQTQIGEKAFCEWCFRRFWSFQEEKILRTDMYGKGIWDKTNQEQSTMDDSSLSRTEIEAERELRDLWNRKCEGCSPQEPRLAEQFIGELTENMSELPQSDSPRIRRLTPLEAERLMGLPDNWTAEGTQGKISDTQRYKMCGNGIVTNVVRDVFEKLLPVYLSK